mmetsp:Transcript_18741/g.23851  ORF Transcript_18741/g.23851 Transcript_18741/m.23851 type:complete len:117 (+) Transcript_18741:2553-2903(+)
MGMKNAITKPAYPTIRSMKLISAICDAAITGKKQPMNWNPDKGIFLRKLMRFSSRPCVVLIKGSVSAIESSPSPTWSGILTVSLLTCTDLYQLFPIVIQYNGNADPQVMTGYNRMK